MDNTQNASNPSSGFSLTETVEGLWIRYARQIVIVAAVIVLAIAAWFAWKTVAARADEAANRKLGAIYVELREENYPAAEQALTAFLAEGPSGVAADKANLYLGKTYFLQQRYDEAIAAYGAVRKRGKDLALLHAGALHGLAASHMQKGQYAEAVTALTELVGTYGVRTGAPQENLAGQEAVDFAPNVPNALWKLALCQRELGRTDDAKATAERLTRAYPGSREARDAAKLLAIL
jgi:TolA-binding protein